MRKIQIAKACVLGVSLGLLPAVCGAASPQARLKVEFGGNTETKWTVRIGSSRRIPPLWASDQRPTLMSLGSAWRAVGGWAGVERKLRERAERKRLKRQRQFGSLPRALSPEFQSPCWDLDC